MASYQKRSGKKGVYNSHCKYGHPMSGTNLRITEKRRKYGIVYERVCKACHSVDSLAYYEKTKSATIGARRKAV